MRLLPRYRPGLPTLALLLLLVAKVRGDCNGPDRIQFAELRSGALQDSYRVGTTLTYRCITGYELISGVIPRITCSNASQWVPEVPRFCQGKKCPPDFENGRFESSTDLRLGDQITFVCNEGYRLIGDSKARCTLSAGKVDWSYRPSCQRIPCFPPPSISHGTITGDRADYAFGDAVTYRCDASYSLIGKNTLVCRVSKDGQHGEWDSQPPECKVVECRRPEIDHGRISAFLPSYKYEHALTITCDTGYNLSAHSLIKCGADNNWHPPVPTCILGAAPSTTPGDGTAPGPVSTKDPRERPGTTKAPEINPDKPGSNNAVAIALGCVGLLILVAVIVLALYCRAHRTQGKTDPSSGPPASYRVVPHGTEMALEEKKEPSQV